MLREDSGALMNSRDRFIEEIITLWLLYFRLLFYLFCFFRCLRFKSWRLVMWFMLFNYNLLLVEMRLLRGLNWTKILKFKWTSSWVNLSKIWKMKRFLFILIFCVWGFTFIFLRNNRHRTSIRVVWFSTLLIKINNLSNFFYLFLNYLLLFLRVTLLYGRRFNFITIS